MVLWYLRLLSIRSSNNLSMIHNNSPLRRNPKNLHFRIIYYCPRRDYGQVYLLRVKMKVQEIGPMT